MVLNKGFYNYTITGLILQCLITKTRNGDDTIYFGDSKERT